MSKVHVRVPHSKDPSSIREQISSFEEMLSKYMVKITWSGNIEIASNFVEVNIKLGMMATAMGIKADKLESSIKKRLEAALA